MQRPNPETVPVVEPGAPRPAWLMVLLMALAAGAAQAQTFRPVGEYPVLVAGDTLAYAWTGGLNQPQFFLADLDANGWKELVVFDRSASRPLVFDWDAAAQQWTFHPNWSQYFPPLSHWTYLGDLTCDGQADLLVCHPDSQGVSFWRGVSPWNWVLEDSLLRVDGEPIYVLSDDIPAVGDVDDDGLIDLLSFDEPGTLVRWYRRHGSCDTLAWELGNACWGQFSEAGLNSDIFLNTGCLLSEDESRGESNRSGGGHAGSTLTLADLDQDGVQDLLVGDLNQNSLVYLHNGGVPAFAVMDQVQTNFPAGSTPVDLQKFPVAWYLDLDQDGQQELLATPNDATISRNANQVWRYEPTGAAASFQRSETDFLVGDMLDFGSGSHPAVVDVNADGLSDLVIGNSSYRPQNSNGSSGLALLLNTGTLGSPVFELSSRNWLNINGFFNPSIFGLRPAFGDLDDDGDTDLLIGDAAGRLHLFTNAAGAGQPLFLTLQASQWLGIDVGEAAAPYLFDLSGDGRLDIVIGSGDGTLHYLENQSSNGNLQFGSLVSGLGGVELSAGAAVPALYEDDQGEPALLVGDAAGQVWAFSQISAPPALPYSLVDSQYADLIPGLALSPFPADLDQDGLPEWLFGSKTGGLRWYEQGSSTAASVVASSVSARYNWRPGEDSHRWYLSVRNGPVLSEIQLKILDLQGRTVWRERVRLAAGALPVDLPGLPTGCYLLHVQDGANGQVIKFFLR